MNNFDFTTTSRQELFQLVQSQLENYYANTKNLRVSSDWEVDKMRHFAQTFGLELGNNPSDILHHTISGLRDFTVHTPHPNYFGLFNPRSNFASILADLITATFNPQLAAWSHSPFANEIENYVIQEFGAKFGYPSKTLDGTFCTGGGEANLTAVISAINHFFPSIRQEGIQSIKGKPLIYCSSESHHTIAKAAKITGLGTEAVKVIEVNHQLELNTRKLKEQIQLDKQNGDLPFLVVGTAGTTGAGAIDNLEAIHQIAVQENLWFHVDAAYGGATIISEKYKSFLSGIEFSDSITLDLHKWFSVPMGTSLFLTQNKTILHQSFGIKTNYMPKDGNPNQIVDPYIHSIQWSRRFIGLKIYLPLAIHGWMGYKQIIEQQFEQAEKLRKMLKEKGWTIANFSPLPLICFTHQNFKSNAAVSDFVNRINTTGKVWLSVYPINGKNTIRACITNYQTEEQELKELVNLLEECNIS